MRKQNRTENWNPRHRNERLERAFVTVVTGKAVGDRRERERMVAQVTAEMRRGWVPPVTLLERLSGPSVNRAGYWLELASSCAEGAPGRRLYKLSERLRQKVSRAPGLRFYVGDNRRTGNGGDELAKLWRLESGVSLSDLRQNMRTRSKLKSGREEAAEVGPRP